MQGYFYINETEKVVVNIMMMKTKFWHAWLNDLDAHALRLDYANSSLSFVIILPNNRTGLGSLETLLKNYNFTQVMEKMEFRRCSVQIPKFKVQSTFSLKEILIKVCFQLNH